ncbi:mannosylphosphorylation protein (Mnn4) [Pochonia chlamydosporia 170]|uniref:Mannosylphosphorylation protein (Mnn4) n=1 Tax=Pochonia chlamydosporia 170 TaxID=1380566 RepID=A0A179FBK0_METCM|nr:mannosylphosphorylation protein (Mnn4) [Pochonia chlamydosporia 170]OAQ62844.1 mannosylphosphorylation protein (Mnn4) [Pochonia chlamydosporia 170]
MRLVQLLGLPIAALAAVVPVHEPKDSLGDQHAISHEDQFFHTSKFESHASNHDSTHGYDSRYMTKPLNELARRDVARALVQSYLTTCRELHVKTWLMGGSLLGWWWGKKMMAWDYSSNVQITESDLHFLAAYHNGTIHFHKLNSMQKGKKYLLEISPDYMNREQGGARDAVDGRWIDLGTGLYLNLTAVRYNPDHERGEGMLYSKNGQEFHDTLLYPLRDTTFEGVPAKIPFRYKEVLAGKYGDGALKNTYYKGHKFDVAEMQWVLQV